MAELHSESVGSLRKTGERSILAEECSRVKAWQCKGACSVRDGLSETAWEGEVGNLSQRECRSLEGGAGGGLGREASMGLLILLDPLPSAPADVAYTHPCDSLEGMK